MKVGQEYGNVAALLSGNLMKHREELKQLLQELSLVRGTFRLSSGRTSDYYLDCKLTTMHPRGALLTGHTILETLEERSIEADAIGGPEVGAIPIVTAVAAVSSLRAEKGVGCPLPAFLVRKHPKEHGRGKQIEGIDLQNLHKVVIVDEVCTGGDSIGIALLAMENSGIEVVAAISLVDRDEGGGEKLRAKYGDRYISIFSAAELLRDSEVGPNAARREKVASGR
jgi:orotate phosphoribosyltransferase